MLMYHSPTTSKRYLRAHSIDCQRMHSLFLTSLAALWLSMVLIPDEFWFLRRWWHVKAIGLAPDVRIIFFHNVPARQGFS